MSLGYFCRKTTILISTILDIASLILLIVMVEKKYGMTILLIPIVLNMIGFCFGCGIMLDLYTQELLFENNSSHQGDAIQGIVYIQNLDKLDIDM